jgi:hypothetical protein
VEELPPEEMRLAFSETLVKLWMKIYLHAVLKVLPSVFLSKSRSLHRLSKSSILFWWALSGWFHEFLAAKYSAILRSPKVPLWVGFCTSIKTNLVGVLPHPANQITFLQENRCKICQALLPQTSCSPLFGAEFLDLSRQVDLA